MESKTYWLRFSVQLSDLKSGNVGNSRIHLPKAIQRTDGVNAHVKRGLTYLVLRAIPTASG